MRDAFGLSKSQGAASAGHVLKMLRRGDPDEDRGDPGQAHIHGCQQRSDRIDPRFRWRLFKPNETRA
jgi:hypothetical protein